MLSHHLLRAAEAQEVETCNGPGQQSVAGDQATFTSSLRWAHTSSAPDSQAGGPDAAPQGGDALLLYNAGADGEHAAVAVGAVSDVELCLRVALEATGSSRRTEAPRPPQPAPGVES